MVAHTLRTLGPKVQATRMVREYVTMLYVPAARSSAALADGSALDGPEADASFGGARELAAWKQRIRAAWHGVRVEHVEADDGALVPGGRLTIRASVALGELSPDDVCVEVVFGRAGDADEILDPVRRALAVDPASAAESVARFTGEAELGEPGPFGYTVRVLPSHPLLTNPAEMGLVAMPPTTSGMVNGDLR
jgi:glycogen phosphorylase